MTSKRDYKRLACVHAAAILQGVIECGCLFNVAEDWSSATDAELEMIEGISAGIVDIISELDRRGRNAVSHAEAMRTR